MISSARRPKKVIKGEFAEDRKEDESALTTLEDNKIVTYSDDKDASWLKKRGKFIYGYKGHNLVNFDGYFLGGHVTPANISDINQLEEMILESNLEPGIPVLADKGYMSKKNVKIVNELGFKDGIMRKKVKNRELTEEEKVKNKKISKVRYRVEQSFGLLKQHFGYDRMRYIGLAKCDLENTLKMLSLNIKKGIYSIAREFQNINKKIIYLN